jgi:hypothetical protein
VLAAVSIWFVLLAQQPSSKPAGITPSWDTGALFSQLDQQAVRLDSMLRQVKPNEWKDAPLGYRQVLDNLLNQNQAALVQIRALAKSPDRLPESIQLLNRLHAVDTMLATTIESVRQYQNPALAELISGVASEGHNAREAFDQRVIDLAAEREQQFQVADHEAQRCRERLSKSPKR